MNKSKTPRCGKNRRHLAVH